MAEKSAEGGVVAVIVLDESEEEGYDPEAAAIQMTPLPSAAAADPTENLFTQEESRKRTKREDDEDGGALRKRHDMEGEEEDDEELMTWPYRRRKPPVPSTVPSSSSSSSSGVMANMNANGRKEDEEEHEDQAKARMKDSTASLSSESISVAMTTTTMPSSPSRTMCTMGTTSGSFPPIDEDALLNDLFGETTDRCSLDKHANGEGKKLKRSLAIEEDSDEAVERKRTKKEEGKKEEGKKSRLKLRSSRERSVNPKIKPLKIIGGAPKLSRSASTGQLEQEKEHKQRAGAPPVRNGDDLTEQTVKLVMRKSCEERSTVDGDGEDSSLNDSIESVEGEECPLCGERFGADELQAHVESELESLERHRGAESAAVPPPTPASETASEESHRPVTRSMARRGSKPAGIEVVVIDDDEEGEDEAVIDDSGMAECPFCQQRFAAGAELEQHVQHEIAVQEGRTHTSPRSITTRPAANSKRANAAGAGQPRKRARLPLVSPPQSKKPRKLPASFGPLDDDDDEEDDEIEEQGTRAKGSTGLTGTLSPFIRRTMNVGAASASSSSTSSASTSSSSASVTGPRAPGAPQPSGGTSGSDANGEGEEEDNYDDVTFNFRPLWSASTQEMPYDYQNQFTKQKKKRGRKKAQEEEEAGLGGGHDVVDLDADDDVVEVDGPSKRGRKRKEAGTTSRSRGKNSTTTTTAKRKSGWRGRRGWYRGRAKR